METNCDDVLGQLLVSMVRADARHTSLAVSFVSTYDERYLAEVVSPAIGASTAPLVARLGLLDRLFRRPSRRQNEHRVPPWPTVVRGRIWIAKPDRWRYEELDDSGAVVRASGCDGVRCWNYAHGSIRQWQPTPDPDVRHLSPTAWQQAPHPPLREIIDPSLVVPALAIESVEERDTTFGPAIRLSGRPRSTDVIDSALVSPWAARSMLDVDRSTGLVVAARNFGADGQTVTEHVVTALETPIHPQPNLFTVPTRESFSSTRKQS